MAEEQGYFASLLVLILFEYLFSSSLVLWSTNELCTSNSICINDALFREPFNGIKKMVDSILLDKNKLFKTEVYYG